MVSHFFGGFSFWEKREKRREGEEEEEEKKEEGRRKEDQMYGLLWVSMEKSNHKPILFNEFGSKRTLFGILVVFGSLRLDLELFWFGFVVDLGLYGN